MSVETDKVGHILVVDDDAMVRQTITNYLEQQSVPAASVSSRRDLSRHLEKAHPSLILLDLRLGKEDGLDVLKEIRSHSDVPIIIMTGHSREEVDRVVGLETWTSMLGFQEQVSNHSKRLRSNAVVVSVGAKARGTTPGRYASGRRGKPNPPMMRR
jgi:CheY-like chemotaxis protein